MIEIVFSDSACGSLKMSQHYGEGEYIGGSIGVIVSKHDGTEPTPEELSTAQKEAEIQERSKWMAATPMGGNPQDVFGFYFMLSIGDISDNNFLDNRQKTINRLWSIYPDDPIEDVSNFIAEVKKTLENIFERLVNGEDVRIWYSSQPDELCGLYWFMAQLKQFEGKLGTVYTIELPKYECCDSGTVVQHSAWGDISPEEWQQYTALARPTTAIFRQHCVAQWYALQKENAPLRANLNGQLLSVSESIYDYFIYCEIANEDDIFHEAAIIGRVLGRYRLGIGDAFIAHRIETMINNDELIVVSDVTKDMPIYHRKLRKNSVWKNPYIL